ncbi:MerR family transcriptional regulator [Gymnodinialimonas hymeniacidonis]|uniref:MerR family transcriptional regulator n=1 Tax=Gymnodinialimonas hymeniacidonis TaxID=3126508 RepID=UPI0034C60C8F
MEKRIEEYSVGQLAKAARISVRTLHHYDAIGLLKPAHVRANGYRLYGRAEAERLQEVLFYRATGMDLAQIAALLDGPEDRLSRLEAHRARLMGQAADLAQVIATLERSIAVIRGDPPMALEDLYTPFTPETQKDHEDWLTQSYGASLADDIATSQAHLSGSDLEASMARLREIEKALVQAFQNDENETDLLLDAHRGWVTNMWGRSCTVEAYAGLAELYRRHAGFVARYEALAPGFGKWLPDTMDAYAARRL